MGCGKKRVFRMSGLCLGYCFLARLACVAVVVKKSTSAWLSCVMVKKLVSVCRKQFVVKKSVEACLECVGDPNTFLLRLRVKNSVSAFLESDVVLLFFDLTQNISRNCLSE
jgi:hypothetical protein